MDIKTANENVHHFRVVDIKLSPNYQADSDEKLNRDVTLVGISEETDETVSVYISLSEIELISDKIAKSSDNTNDNGLCILENVVKMLKRSKEHGVPLPSGVLPAIQLDIINTDNPEERIEERVKRLEMKVENIEDFLRDLLKKKLI